MLFSLNCLTKEIQYSSVSNLLSIFIKGMKQSEVPKTKIDAQKIENLLRYWETSKISLYFIGIGLPNTLELEHNFLNLERYINKTNNLLFHVTLQKLACTLHFI